MIKARITAAIREVIDNDCGFDAFVMMKDESKIKRLTLYEGDPEGGEENFKADIGAQIRETIRNKFLAEDAQYSLAEQLGDNQKKFYVIRRDEAYDPFPVIDMPEKEMESFSVEDTNEAQGFLFRFAVGGSKVLWAYQHIWPIAIPSRKKESRLLKKLSPDAADVFVECKDTIFAVTQKVDLIIIRSTSGEEEVSSGSGADTDFSEIVTSDISLMERIFGLETFMKASARQVIESINAVGLVANTDKLTDYLNRGGGNKRYARKMMRVKNSKVFELPYDVLREKLDTVERWKGKFQFEDEKIVLDTYRNVEDLIDLFDERYTRSDITGQEYDTDVKSLAADVGEGKSMVNI